MKSPYIADDGSHIIPVGQVHYTGCESYPNAIGELMWHPESGARFIVQFPDVSGAELPRYFGRPAAQIEAGRIQQKTTVPHWIARTACGAQAEIFELNAVPTSTRETGTGGSRFYSSVTVEVTTAAVELLQNSPLSFWHETPPETRMMCLGFSSSYWPIQDEVTYEIENGTRTTGRGTIELATSPHVRLITAGRFNLPDKIKATWLVSDQLSDGREYPNRNAQGFISFLNGRRTPFFWHDAFSGDQLRRTYYGWHKYQFVDLQTSYSQPLPLYGTTESLTHAHEVVPKLPDLFSEFVKEADAMRLTWTLNPLWQASKSILDDRFALTCISLERLAEAWRKKMAQSARPPFFSAGQQTTIRKSVLDALKLVASTLELSADQQDVLMKRVNNICAPPNADKLGAVFTDLGIVLSPADKDAIKKRNTQFHGQPTLGNPNDLADLNKEVDQCDCLHVLITKAILLLLKYRGPFMNYSVRSGSQVDCL
jgi:hypothetical protein